MILRNIHTRVPVDELPPVAQPPRLRALTNDPEREFAQRPGEVERLPDSIAACILSARRFATVTRSEIKLKIDTVEHKYFHPDSITIRGTGDERRVLVCFNRHDPSVIHILKDDGEYVESISEKGKAEFFSQSDTARELANSRAVETGLVNRLKHVHAEDSRQALEDSRHNQAELQKVVHTLPLAPERKTEKPVTASRFPKAERISEAFEGVDRARAVQAEHSRRIQSTRGEISDIYGDRVPAPEPESEPEEVSLRDLM